MCGDTPRLLKAGSHGLTQVVTEFLTLKKNSETGGDREGSFTLYNILRCTVK